MVVQVAVGGDVGILGGVYAWESNSGICVHPASIFPIPVGLRLPQVRAALCLLLLGSHLSRFLLCL